MKAVSAALRGSSTFSCVCCPSPFLGLGWLGHRFVAPPATPGFWSLLMLGCAVLTPWPLAAPSPFVTVDFFLGRLFGLGLVGHVCASVPTFFWWCSPSRVLGFAWRLWPLGGLGTCCFLGPYLGFFPLASNVGRWLEVVEVYPWWSSLRSFGVEVVTLVLCQALVGLPSGHCCASGLLGPVVFLTSC